MSDISRDNHFHSKTIDEVIQQLDEIIGQSIKSDDYIFAFTTVYRKTTQKIKEAIEAGRFEDGKRMENLDVVFANLFIQAYYDYITSKSIPKSWNIAFQSKNKKLTLVQHILLGMNAHINLDLSVAAASVSQGNIMLLKNDFMIINDILGEITNSMQKDLGKVSILMKLLDFLGFRSDEKIINFSIKKARDFAWLNAIELSLLKGKKKELRISEIDLRVSELGKIIINPPGHLLRYILKIIASFETSDKQRIIEKLNI